jgi:hypothetical protein
MDLRSLINKLDTIEQRTLLQESEQLIDEAARLRYKDVEAVAQKFPTDEVARGKALADLAKANGLPGLFDPVSRELVKLDGTLANFAGADQATVNQLKQWGLLPLGAKTSSWLGFRGEDEKSAMGTNQSAQARDALTDKAMALMDKAVQAAAAPAATEGVLSTSGIASALIEEFGFNGVELLEAVTSAEHTELKKLVQDLYKAAPNDPDVVQVTTTYTGYVKQRDQIIQRINELIKIIKAKPAPAVKVDTKVVPKAKESLETSKRRMIAEGRIQVLEDGKRYLRDGLEWTYDPKTELYSHLNEDGTLTEYDKKQFYSDAGDFGRGVADGLTLGYADNISAGVQSLFTNKTYKDALKAELAKSKEADDRSPWLYGGGQIVGFIANPLSKIGLGLPGTLGKLTTGVPLVAAKLASDKFVREPLNKMALGADSKKVPPQPMLNGKPSTGPKGQEWLKKYGATHNPDGTPKAGTVKTVDAPKAATTAVDAKPAAEPIVKAAELGSQEFPVEKNITSEPGQKSAIDALTPTDNTSAADAQIRKADQDISAQAAAPTNMAAADAQIRKADQDISAQAAAPEVAQAPVQVDLAKIKLMIADIRKLATANGLDFYTAMDQYANTANLAEGIQLTSEQQQYLTEINSIRRLSGLPLFEVGLDTAANLALRNAPKAGEVIAKGAESAWNAIKGGWNKLTGSAEKAATKPISGAPSAEIQAQIAKKAADDALFAAKQAAEKVKQIPAFNRTLADKVVLDAERKAAERVAALAAAEKAAVSGAEKAAVSGAEGAAEKTLISRFGEKAVAAVSKLKSLGGRVLSFMKNNKFLTLAAMIGAAGYIFGPNGVEEENITTTTTTTTDPVVDPTTPVDGKCTTPGYRLSADGKTCEKVGEGGQEVTPVTPVTPVAPDLSELQKLVDQLYGGWPTDPETAAALAAAKAAGAKVPEGSGTAGQAGMDVVGSGNTAKRPVTNSSSPTDVWNAMDAMIKKREAEK